MTILKNLDITLLRELELRNGSVSLPHARYTKSLSANLARYRFTQFRNAGNIIRSLPEAFGRQVVIHNPGTKQLSWDEKWYSQ